MKEIAAQRKAYSPSFVWP